ncbi:hypothetical protein P170DRAFT_475056 [Aspergillus steynii IBT 23096]|uniref:Uncharacterized protein n=1 Tax=Aspergillus steynii IBT 23096 TaxID=1392250 RepID=A0A2I2G745_9EURO|nr:uncharacterized protein P170DRAFT_475056 [Aspergillus steynii IBT 23096]PLB48709.1 hypothetical protein P170DRAFT_475056 [Aspergillus steynii IBT 23096]
MSQEILVTTDDLGVPTLRLYDPSNDGTPTGDISSETIKDISPQSTFVFTDPDNLGSIFRNAETHEQIANHMRRLRLVILNSIADAALTHTEEEGGVDGPHISPLIDKWWVACRAIPRGHAIEHVIFDLSFPRQIAKREIVRLLQGMSTTMSMKSSGKFECYTEGDLERKAWLEKSLVGLKKSED